MQLVGLTGYAGSGKDTVGEMLMAHANFGRRFAFADTLREEIVEAFDLPPSVLTWRSTKNTPCSWINTSRCKEPGFRQHWFDNQLGAYLSPREVMQSWGDWRRGQHPDYFVERMRDKLLHNQFVKPALFRVETTIITDVRYQNEVDLIRSFGGFVLKVTRPGVGPVNGHSSDNQHLDADGTIDNNGTLDQLAEAVDQFHQFINTRTVLA